jgi:hypothetical protein
MNEDPSTSGGPPASVDLRVVRGIPTDEELAALVGVLLLRGQSTVEEEPVPPSRWVVSARPGYAHRDGRPVRPGARAWQSTALPR